MDKSRLIGGIICLALAGLLAILNVVLPADKMMFMVGETNMSFVPPIILGIVGIVLLATGRSGAKENGQEESRKGR